MYTNFDAARELFKQQIQTRREIDVTGSKMFIDRYFNQ